MLKLRIGGLRQGTGKRWIELLNSVALTELYGIFERNEKYLMLWERFGRLGVIILIYVSGFRLRSIFVDIRLCYF